MLHANYNNPIIFYSKYIPEIPKEFNNKKFFAFAGIGNPENFFDTLREYGLKVAYQLRNENINNHFDYKYNLKKSLSTGLKFIFTF